MNQILKPIRKTFYTSQIYQGTFNRIEPQDNSNIRTTRRCDDEKDQLPEILGNSSFQIKENRREQESVSGIYQFIGEDAVLCRIKQIKIYEKSAPYNPTLNGMIKDYRRVLEISSMPASRELPKELRSILYTSGYQEAQLSDKQIEKLEKI